MTRRAASGGQGLRLSVLALALAAPALARKPPPPPPLPPLILDARAPIITVEIAGQPVRLRVDPGSNGFVQLNASIARRLDLANPARLVGNLPVRFGRLQTKVGRVTVTEQTSDELITYAGRQLPLSVAWGAGDFVDDADGLIVPTELPQDEVRFVLRPRDASDITATFPMRWIGAIGMLANLPGQPQTINLSFSLASEGSIATAAAGALLARSNGGHLTGADQSALIMLGVSRPVRTLTFDRPVEVGPLKLRSIATRIFDWSGGTSIPDETADPDQIIVQGRMEAQPAISKITIGRDHLDSCAELVWRRLPFEMTLTCSAPR
jgi:hypothetical protein